LHPSGRASGLGGARLASELHDQAQLALAQDRLDRADDSGLPGDLDPLAELEWLLVLRWPVATISSPRRSS
jgi:hypothetical protein